MADLFQPSPFYLFVIFFKTILYIPLCASLGLVMSIFSEGKSRLASVMITILCLIIIFATNPILISMESLDLFIFIETLSKLVYGWFLPFFISSLFFVRTILYRFSNLVLEILHLILFTTALFFLILTV